jgi:hypothetical protein
MNGMILIAQQHQLDRPRRCRAEAICGLTMKDTRTNRALILLAGMIGGALMAALQTRLLEL